jgi:hypothetical protein
MPAPFTPTLAGLVGAIGSGLAGSPFMLEVVDILL